MSFEVRQSTDFRLKELNLVTKGGVFDIKQIYEEINIFDSLFNPCMSGNILIRDALNLSEKLLFDGSEILAISVGKSEDEIIFKKSFRIYKQSDRRVINQTSETYILHFFSDEFLFSEQQKVNQAYKATYSEIATSILIDYLKVPIPQLKGIFDQSAGIKDVVIPNLKPFDAIEWCAKRAVDAQSSPNFMFFQNILGYNFASLSTLLSQDSLFNVNFDPKNLTPSVNNEMVGARSLRIISQFDLVNTTRSGVYAGKFIGFDPMTRTIATRKLTFGDHYLNMKHGNKTANFSVIKNRDNIDNTEMYDSKKTLASFSESLKYSNYVKRNDPSSINSIEDTHNFLFQRKALLTNLTTQRVAITLPGNFTVSSGLNLFLKVPSKSIKTKGDDNYDLSLYGKYLILGTRHIIKYDKHETIVETATSSNEKDFVAGDTTEQINYALNYDESAA